MKSGFTLIELSIVLVIIGLIIGGILVGQDLITAAAQRAQIAQIEKYNTAVHTFQSKYGYLPGDIPDPYASNFGFLARGQYAGEGDGNGILEGNCNNISNNHDGVQTGCGELAVFWADLSVAGLIDTAVPTGTNYQPETSTHPFITITPSTSVSLQQWMPTAKIGSANFIHLLNMYGTNYYTVASVVSVYNNIKTATNPGINVQQAYNIDTKIDDGLPQSGNIIACYVNSNISNYATLWAAGNGLQGQGSGSYDNAGWGSVSKNYCLSTTTVTPVLSTNCFDNNNNTGTETYSIAHNASIANCALSFKFQ